MGQSIISRRSSNPVLRCAALFLSALFFANNVLLAHSAETHIWKERRQAALHFAPSVQQPLLTNKSRPDYLNTLSAFGHVKDVYSPSNSVPQIILIQDVHLNCEAQINIANTIKALMKRRTVETIAVEGAFGNFDFSPVQSFSGDVRKKVAADFLEQSRISAASFIGMTADGPLPQMIGVDDLQHYKANVKAYLAASKVRPVLIEDVAVRKRSLDTEKSKQLNLELKKYDRLLSRYRAGKIGIGGYLHEISKITSFNRIASEGNAQSMLRFLEAYQLEATLDFPEIERERMRVIDRLAARLNETDANMLASVSAAVRAGTVSFADYYRFVQSMLLRARISLKDTPAFDQYVRYVLLSDLIDADRLLKAVAACEERLTALLSRDGSERELMKKSRDLYLEEKILDFALIPDEWERYRGLSAISSQLSGKADSGQLIGESLKVFEDFYLEADTRTELMARNILEARKPVVLIMGGFHTPLLTQRLREQEVSYAVFQPKITKIGDKADAGYLSIFDREK